jgi:hypothetical protein
VTTIAYTHVLRLSLAFPYETIEAPFFREWMWSSGLGRWAQQSCTSYDVFSITIVQVITCIAIIGQVISQSYFKGY